MSNAMVRLAGEQKNDPQTAKEMITKVVDRSLMVWWKQADVSVSDGELCHGAIDKVDDSVVAVIRLTRFSRRAPPLHTAGATIVGNDPGLRCEEVPE